MYKKLKAAVVKFIPPRYLEFIFNRGFSQTLIPKKTNTKISDLFHFRIYDKWETYFELINYSDILAPNEEPRRYFVSLYFFDSNGILFKKIKLANDFNFKQSLKINDYLKEFSENTKGTFAVFHHFENKIYQSNKSFLSESGYASYYSPKYPIKNFVHGNIDAIGKFKSNLIPLGSVSFKSKYYNLQHPFETLKYNYELFFINPTKNNLKFVIYEQIDEEKLTKTYNVKSRGCFTHTLTLRGIMVKVRVKSKLYMARPIVFKFGKEFFDVFHS